MSIHRLKGECNKYNIGVGSEGLRGNRPCLLLEVRQDRAECRMSEGSQRR